MLSLCIFAAMLILACTAAVGLIAATGSTAAIIEALPDALESIEATGAETKTTV
jgi:hypothetical protein